MISIIKATLCVLTLTSVAHSSVNGTRRRLTQFMGTAIGIHLDPKFKPRTKHASTTEGLMDIGKQCAECNFLDILPLKCESCRKYFCKVHLQDHSSVVCAQFGQKPSPSHSKVTFTVNRLREAKKIRKKFLRILKKLHDGEMPAANANLKLRTYWNNLTTPYSDAGYTEILDRNADGWLEGATPHDLSGRPDPKQHVTDKYRRCPA